LPRNLFSGSFLSPAGRQHQNNYLNILDFIPDKLSKASALLLHIWFEMKRILQNQRLFQPVRATASFMTLVLSTAAWAPQFAFAGPNDTAKTKKAAAAAVVTGALRGQRLAPQVAPISSSVAGARLETSARREKVEVPKPAQENLAPVHVFDFRDPDSKELIRFQYQPTPTAELLKFSPSKVRAMETVGIPNKMGFTGATKKLVKEFPAEYIAFTIAVGISTAIHLDNDPAFAHNFVESNTSKEGVVSFFGFVAASRASHAMFQAFGMAYDPRRAMLNYHLQPSYVPGQPQILEVAGENGQKIKIEVPGQPRIDAFKTKLVGAPAGPTRFQRNFAPLLGPIGLSAGMTVSNVIHEVMADQNLWLCAKARYLHPEMPKDPEAAKMMAATVDEACDKAWEDWTLSKKFADYAPDLFSMSMASFIQAYVVNKAILGGSSWVVKQGFLNSASRAGILVGENAISKKLEIQAVSAGAEKFIPWVLRGIQIGEYTLGSSPWGRFAVTVGNIAMFMEIVHPITPLIKQPFERWRQGSDITERINKTYEELSRTEQNKWVWEPRPDSDFCVDDMLDPNGYATSGVACMPPEQYPPSVLLKKMAQRQAKWREFILADAYLGHQNWQTYVSRFATNYANATSFYHQIFAHINIMRNSPKESRRVSYLYAETPLHGLYSDPSKRDAAGARKAVFEAAAWLETYLEGARLKAPTGKAMAEVDRVNLQFILNGLKAIDPAVDIKSLGAVEVAFGNLGAMNDVQRRDFEARVRERLLADAIVRLRKILKDDPKFNDRRIPLSSPMYKELADWNPFMALRMRLGDPEPLAAGVAFIREANDDATVIEQSTKSLHPDAIGRMSTNTMADYLVVSMVCGPDADPQFSQEDKIRIYKSRKLTTFESLLDRFGLGTPMPQPSEADLMIAVREYREALTANDSSWAHLFRPNATGVEWAGFRAEFRPPRVVRGVPESVCKDWADNSNRDLPLFDPYTAKWTFNGKNYDGILDIIRQHARADIVGSQLPPKDLNAPYDDPFDKWWTANVDNNVVPMIAKFRSNYRELLKKKYIPALTKNGVDGEAEYNKRKIKLGALEALYEETKLYLLIIGKTTQITKDAKVRKNFDDLSTSIVLEFKNMGQLVTDLDFVEQKGVVANASFETKRKALETQLEALQKFVDERQTAIKATEEVQNVNMQVLKNMSGLLGEMDSYWGIVRGIQVVSQ
jgi:hypothetical protein